MDTFELLRVLCESNGTSGAEDEAAAVAVELLGKYMPTHRDALGNVIGDTGVQGKTVLLDAHLDEIGMIVTAIDDKGFIKVAKCGGADPLVLVAADVTVHGKEQVFGVVTSTPPHLAKGEEKKVADFSDIAIDVGMSKEEAESIISVGDRITLNGKLKKLLNSRVCGASLDDRCGVASILLCLDMLGEKVKELPIRVMFSSCEETGGSGAMVGGFAAKSYEAIAVDVSFAKSPGTKENVRANLGKGTMIGFAPTLNFEMSHKLESLAKEKGIDYQTEVMSGRTGTNADEICTAGEGTRMALLSIPLRSMHTPVEVIDIKDVEDTAKLMAQYILTKEGC